MAGVCMGSGRGRFGLVWGCVFAAAGLTFGAQPRVAQLSTEDSDPAMERGAAIAARFKDFKPVTDAILEKPDAADWIHWRRTADAWGYSPLNQINRSNAHQLQPVWARPLGAGSSIQP